MRFPVGDWQFWVVTGVVVVVVVAAMRPFVRSLLRKPGTRKVTLTIERDRDASGVGKADQ